jgi:hypothetical protein
MSLGAYYSSPDVTSFCTHQFAVTSIHLLSSGSNNKLASSASCLSGLDPLIHRSPPKTTLYLPTTARRISHRSAIIAPFRAFPQGFLDLCSSKIQLHLAISMIRLDPSLYVRSVE